ncbi:MAG: histidinol dehydrogenase [Ruminococcaceae bacterium]|nr:histidinol dehydrogenase [Oscillospiraceae bacterium]
MIKIMKYGEVADQDIFARAVPEIDVSAVVADIIATVRAQGDSALLAYNEKFEKAKLSTLQVTREELDAALDAVDPEFLAVLERAAENIRAFHARQLREGFRMEDKGTVLGQKVIPIEKVGLCVPGGVTPLSSTVLMDAIPAKIAGCSELVMVTPPRADGTIDASILAAAKVAGVDKIFKIGGAQAVAALAYGTESVPKVDKIVGPGGSFVAEAKKQVFGQVSIDMIAGPSEILVVADGANDPRHVAADMLSQAEHDRMAAAVLVTDSQTLAEQVQQEIERQLPLLAREAIARVSVDNNGKIIVTDDLHTALDVANAIAPEHLELCVEDPFAWLEQVKHAGSVFLGRSCPEALGDYFAGANHTLPTSGTARFSSPLSVDDFVKKTQYIYYSDEALAGVADQVARFAMTEGLTGHARSVTVRGEE